MFVSWTNFWYFYTWFKYFQFSFHTFSRHFILQKTQVFTFFFTSSSLLRCRPSVSILLNKERKKRREKKNFLTSKIRWKKVKENKMKIKRKNRVNFSISYLLLKVSVLLCNKFTIFSSFFFLHMIQDIYIPKRNYQVVIQKSERKIILFSAKTNTHTHKRKYLEKGRIKTSCKIVIELSDKVIGANGF